MKKILIISFSLVVITIVIITFVSLTGEKFNKDIKSATEFTKKKHTELYSYLKFENKQDFIDADKGFIKSYDAPSIKDENGKTVINLEAFKFLQTDEEAPETVNPSLWRISQLNAKQGLYKVIDGIYQIRGLDISNMTIVESSEGIIVIDPLLSTETAKAALELYYENVLQPENKRRPIKGIVYTHSHVDHFGGVGGIVTREEVKNNNIKIIAPKEFLEEAVAENIYAGTIMTARAKYMYGMVLPIDKNGYVGTGLGGIQAQGNTSLIEPNVTIKNEIEKLTLDGIEMEFQLAMDTEAPSEMLIYFPQFRTLCTAENTSNTLHNLYTLRGAKVRDPNNWWKALDKSIQNYGHKTDTIFAQHHWPKWGNANIIKFLKNQRDGWKYLNDKTLYYANQGYNSTEIAELLVDFPKDLATEWYMRGYYGTVNHNVKAVYQRYLGWFDANPANLNSLPPEELGREYVEFMGGSKKIIKKAKKYYKNGEYRFVAEVLKHVVFAEPDNQQAKNLLADALEQMGYQAESGPWRNFFLTGAFELRNGAVKLPLNLLSIDFIRSMTKEMVIDYLSIGLNIEKSQGKTMKVNWLVDGEKMSFELRNSILIYTSNVLFKDADLTINTSKLEMLKLFEKATTVDESLKTKQLIITGGNVELLKELIEMKSSFNPNFEIVLP